MRHELRGVVLCQHWNKFPKLHQFVQRLAKQQNQSRRAFGRTQGSKAYKDLVFTKLFRLLFAFAMVKILLEEGLPIKWGESVALARLCDELRIWIK